MATLIVLESVSGISLKDVNCWTVMSSLGHLPMIADRLQGKCELFEPPIWKKLTELING
jgi:hypothetical protein